MAGQLFVDLYECDEELLDDLERIRDIAHKMVAEIGAGIVEECMHKFEPIGVTYIAVITTSHFSIHTWPEYGYAAVDVFSCEEELPQKLADKLKEAFSAKSAVANRFTRNIERRNYD